MNRLSEHRVGMSGGHEGTCNIDRLLAFQGCIDITCKAKIKCSCMCLLYGESHIALHSLSLKCADGSPVKQSCYSKCKHNDGRKAKQALLEAEGRHEAAGRQDLRLMGSTEESYVKAARNVA